MTVHHHFSEGAGRRGRMARAQDEGFAAVEQQLAMLQDAITPGDGHRSRVLETTSDSVTRHRGKVRSAKVTIALSLLLIAVSPLIGALTKIPKPAAQTADRAQADALRHAEAGRMSFDWALVDVFNRFRESKRP